MIDKYANLIKELENTAEVYKQAVYAANKMKGVISGLDDVIGVTGSFVYLNELDLNLKIHLSSEVFAQPAIYFGTDFKMEDGEDYARFECSLFGYRVFALFGYDEPGYDHLLKRAKLDEKNYFYFDSNNIIMFRSR